MFGLWGAPPDRVQSDAQRLMYLHVPSAWIAYLAFGVTALSSALYLWRRTRSPVWDRLAGASAELGVLFTGADPDPRFALGPSGVGRVVGVGRPAGDHRSPLLPLRRLPGAASGPVLGRDRAPSAAPSRRSIAFVDVPIVHFSVNWWRTLHQQATVFTPSLNAHIHGVMAFTLWWGVLAFTLVYVYLLDKRYRLEALEEDRDARELAQAIDERVHGAGVAAPAERAGVGAGR